VGTHVVRPRSQCCLRELDVVAHLDEAVRVGVLRTPTLVVDGQVRLAGAITESAFTATKAFRKVHDGTQDDPESHSRMLKKSHVRVSQIGDHAWPRDVRVGCRRVMPSAGGGPDVARRCNQG